MNLSDLCSASVHSNSCLEMLLFVFCVISARPEKPSREFAHSSGSKLPPFFCNVFSSEDLRGFLDPFIAKYASGRSSCQSAISTSSDCRTPTESG